MTAPKPEIYNLQFWLLCLSSFLFFGSFNMIIPELPGYITSLGGEEFKGLIISLFTLTAGLSRPFSGKLTDRVGRIPVMIYGVAVCVICGFLYPVLSSVAGFLLLRLVHGMSTGFKPTATSAYVADLIPFARRGEAMGILGLCGNIGMASGPAIGSYIALEYSTDTMFQASSLAAGLSILVLAGMKETLQNREKFSLSLLRIHRREVVEPRVFPPSIVMMLTIFAWGAILTIIPDFSDHLGIKNKGLFFSCFTVASIAVRVFAGQASDKFGREPVIRLGLVLMIVALVLIGFSETAFFLLGSAVVFGLAVGMCSPTLFAWTIDLSDDAHRGRGIATMYIALEIGIGAGALISSAVYHNDPAMFKYAFWICAVSVLGALVYLQHFINRSRSQKLKEITP